MISAVWEVEYLLRCCCGCFSYVIRKYFHTIYFSDKKLTVILFASKDKPMRFGKPRCNSNHGVCSAVYIVKTNYFSLRRNACNKAAMWIYAKSTRAAEAFGVNGYIETVR